MYDQLDANGQVVRANFQLGMYDKLPEGHRWVEHVSSPEDAKKLMWTAIKAERERLSSDGGYSVAVDGVPKWFHSDPKSKTQQLALVMFGASVPPVLWKTMDKSKVPMTQALAGQIFQAASLQDMALFAAGEAHYDALQLSLDPANYDYSGGWPAVYVATP